MEVQSIWGEWWPPRSLRLAGLAVTPVLRLTPGQGFPNTLAQLESPEKLFKLPVPRSYSWSIKSQCSGLETGPQ